MSPKRQNLGILLPTTPPTVFPEWIPILHCNLGNLEELSHIFFNVLFRERDNWAISSACLFPKIIKVELEKVAKWEDINFFFYLCTYHFVLVLLKPPCIFHWLIQLYKHQMKKFAHQMPYKSHSGFWKPRNEILCFYNFFSRIIIDRLQTWFLYISYKYWILSFYQEIKSTNATKHHRRSIIGIWYFLKYH